VNFEPTGYLAAGEAGSLILFQSRPNKDGVSSGVRPTDSEKSDGQGEEEEEGGGGGGGRKGSEEKQ
jgi:hypothetical protein